MSTEFSLLRSSAPPFPSLRSVTSYAIQDPMNHFTSTTTSNTSHSNMSRFTSNTTEQEEKERQENENNKQNDYAVIHSLNNLRDRKQGQYDKPTTQNEYHQLTLLNMTINFTITQSEDNATITITHPQTSDFTLEYSIEAARLEYRKWLKRGAKVTE